MSMHDNAGDAFDARARSVHAASLDRLSARVNAQLAQRRRAALEGESRRASHGVLRWAGVATAGLALALVVQLRPPGSGPVAPHAGGVATRSTAVVPAAQPRIAAVTPSPASRLPTAADADVVAPDLSEDPEFYLWLGDERPARTE
ncbi:hypothetical protein [Lysobacter claricitrinus]|uniref:hypothetical protein n=1 Tax=Lysobacter claricitrinus TaxID=3367728 RepID=UPI0037DB0DC5